MMMIRPRRDRSKVAPQRSLRPEEMAALLADAAARGEPVALAGEEAQERSPKAQRALGARCAVLRVERECLEDWLRCECVAVWNDDAAALAATRTAAKGAPTSSSSKEVLG